MIGPPHEPTWGQASVWLLKMIGIAVAVFVAVMVLGLILVVIGLILNPF
jgi:hypothetical protein